MPHSIFYSFFFFNATATPEIYTLSLHDALPIALGEQQERSQPDGTPQQRLHDRHPAQAPRALVHTGSNHEYHSLTRAQPLVQKRITSCDAGRCPLRTPSRTPIVLLTPWASGGT